MILFSMLCVSCLFLVEHVILFVIFFTQLLKDRNMVTQLVRRAENAGFKAIVLTADSPVLGHKEADIKNRLTIIEKIC